VRRIHFTAVRKSYHNSRFKTPGRSDIGVQTVVAIVIAAMVLIAEGIRRETALRAHY
jgi:hypothetical protein